LMAAGAQQIISKMHASKTASSSGTY